MKVYIEKDDITKEIKLDKEIELKTLLNKLNITVESVIIEKNGEICLEDEQVGNEDNLRILSVVSGG